jgi:hypothetical protein
MGQLHDSDPSHFPARNYVEETRVRLEFKRNINRMIGTNCGKEEKNVLNRRQKFLKEYLRSHSLFAGFPGISSLFGTNGLVEQEDTIVLTKKCGVNPEERCPGDPMHNFDHGPLKDISHLTNDIFLNENKKSSSILAPGKTAGARMRELNRRMRYFYSIRLDSEGNRYLPTFRSGVENLGFLRAIDHRYLSQMYLFCIGTTG